MSVKKTTAKKPEKTQAKKTVRKKVSRKTVPRAAVRDPEEAAEFEDPTSALWAEGISIIQARWVQEYVDCNFNGTEATLRLFPNKTRGGAQSSGSLYKHDPKVQEAIKKYLQYITDDYKEKLRLKYMETISTRAFFDVQDLIDEDGNIKPSKELGKMAVAVDDVYFQKKGRGYTKQPKVADREKALAAIGQLIGLTESEDGGQTRVVILTGTLSQEEWTKQAQAMKK